MDNICMLSFQTGNSNTTSFASASIIKYKGKLFIATAAHCLHNVHNNEIAKNVKIRVNNQGFMESFNVPNIVIPQKWIDTQMLTYDYAFGRVEINNSVRDIAFSPDFNFNRSLKKRSKVVTLAGYRFSLFKTKKKYSRGNLDMTLFENEQLIGMESKHKHGMSGGPWFFETSNEKLQIGVTSAKIKSFKNMVWASMWTKETEKVLNKLLISDMKQKIIIG